MSKHKHAESMVLYAQDAMETDEPWERWESRNCENNVWCDLDNHPCWFTHREYRRKDGTTTRTNRTTVNIHAELIAEYAKDWAETDKPWERWEYRHCKSKVWSALECHTCWLSDHEYRRKPRTISINGYEVPEPLREIPEDAGHVYEVIFITGVSTVIPYSTANFENALRNGLVHATRDAALQHVEALRSFTKQQTEQ